MGSNAIQVPESAPCKALVVWLAITLTTQSSWADEPFKQIRAEYASGIRPLLKQFCLECHSTEAMEGELDLERFTTLQDVRSDPQAWQKVVEMLNNGEMPPEDNPQPTSEQKKHLLGWARRYLHAEARANAGDPGPVVLRRLNNAEYTYTIRDLTDVELDPAREFPTDGAAGEGFTNTGNSLVMSPALVQKYLDAGKDIASHAVLLPDGFRFSQGMSRRDWTDEILAQIRSIYIRHIQGRAPTGDVQVYAGVADAMSKDGRVDLERYFAALLRHRERLLSKFESVRAVARQEKLNAKYLRLLGEMLTTDETLSPLLASLRESWRRANHDDAAVLAASIRAWQDQLWKFNRIGQKGIIRKWQEPVSPAMEAQQFRVKLDPPASGDVVRVYLVAGTAGDGTAGDVVAWQNARIEQPPIMLRDLRAATIALDRIRQQTVAQISKYLAAAFEARSESANRELGELAEAHGVDPLLLKPLLSYLGIWAQGEVEIKQYLNEYRSGVGGYEFVTGWGLKGVSDLSILGNSSDQTVDIPGSLVRHTICVHPHPQHWVAAGWKSPIDGRVRIAPTVGDRHHACGNGVSWRLELRRGERRRVLVHGDVDQGKTVSIEPLREFPVLKGDLISLIVGARDDDHSCDLTEIELEINEESGEQQKWLLSGDCAGSMDAGNPHPDSYGSAGIWHFYTGMVGSVSVPFIPPGSLIARWLDTDKAETAARLASELEILLTTPPVADTSKSDAELYHQLTALDGPLFTQIDWEKLARSVSREELQAGKFGLDPQLFGHEPDGATAPSEHLIVHAPSVIEIQLPASLAAGAVFSVTASLTGPNHGEGSVQVQVATADDTRFHSLRSHDDAATLLPGIPIVTQRDGKAEARIHEAFDDFRSMFPTAMCHAQIVPVDEVVTLVLFHREDEHLIRLMLDEAEKARLERLWDELFFVSQDALRILDVLEQSRAYASQDSNFTKFDSVQQPITDRAAAFRRRLTETEPAQLEALLEFAARAWRRPLNDNETSRIRLLYEKLRAEDSPHDEAFRLTLARVLSAPAFLYRFEKPGAGSEPTAVSDRELASRLSYFLWSSLPDAQLRQVADAGELVNSDTLVSQTRRMLRDPRTRRLAIEFACQWLHIRDFDQLDDKSERHFPQFAELRGDMYEESVRFFEDLFRRDGSILEILDANHTFLNEALATHYGIPGVTGPEWRRIDGVREYSRGGILAQATTLARQSGASRTSPILRGNWIAETLLGERLPRPPKDVPQLPDDEAALDGLTVRELVEKHSSVAECAKCHQRIDPYGFALESFDAIGRVREKDLGDRPIQTDSTLMDGTRIDGLSGLRGYLLTTRREAFLRHFCRKLLGYALGRAVQLSDDPLLDEIMGKLDDQDYRISVAIDTIVLSEQFRMIRGNIVERNSFRSSSETE